MPAPGQSPPASIAATGSVPAATTGAKSFLRAEYVVAAVVTAITLWLVLYPLGWLIWGSLHKGAPGDVGLSLTFDNFLILFNADYWRLLLRSVLVGVGITALATLIGLPLAWVTVKTDIPCKRLIEIAAILPFFITTFIGALAWIFLANPTNGLLKLWFGLPVNIYSMGGIIWVTGLYMAPYIYLFSASALRNLDTSLEEASFMARGGLFRTLTRVTFPLILPALLSGMSLVLVISMDIFGVAAILGFPARITLLATEVYVRATLVPPDFGRAAVAGMSLIVITMALLFFQHRYLARRSYAVVSGRGFRIKLYSLGKLRPIVLVICSFYGVFAVLLPLLVLIKTSLQVYPTPRFTAWTLNNWTVFFGNSDLFNTLMRSLYLSTFGATLCVLFTAAIAYIVQRSKIPGRRVLEQIASIPVGTPGIVLGLGMMWAYITWPIWGSIWVLVIAYMTLFMPYGVRALGANIMQIHPELEESSRVHRASWLRTLALIVLPLLRSGIFSTWIMLFIIFIREISAAVLLASINTQVFPVLIFQQWAAGNFNVMSAGALLLSAIMLVVIAIFRWVFKVDVVPSYR